MDTLKLRMGIVVFQLFQTQILVGEAGTWVCKFGTFHNIFNVYPLISLMRFSLYYTKGWKNEAIRKILSVKVTKSRFKVVVN